MGQPGSLFSSREPCVYVRVYTCAHVRVCRGWGWQGGHPFSYQLPFKGFAGDQLGEKLLSNLICNNPFNANQMSFVSSSSLFMVSPLSQLGTDTLLHLLPVGGNWGAALPFLFALLQERIHGCLPRVQNKR